MECEWADRPSAGEDAALLEQPAESSVSTELKGKRCAPVSGIRVTAVTVFFLLVCVILSVVFQVLAGGTHRSNRNLPDKHDIAVFYHQVSGSCSSNISQKIHETFLERQYIPSSVKSFMIQRFVESTEFVDSSPVATTLQLLERERENLWLEILNFIETDFYLVRNCKLADKTTQSVLSVSHNW